MQNKQAIKLKKLADGLNKQIEAKLNSGTAGQNPTPRRQRIIDGQRADAEKLQRIQQVLLNLADQWEDSTIAAPWSNIKSKKELEAIDIRFRSPAPNGFVYHWEVDQFALWEVNQENFAAFMEEYKRLSRRVETPESLAEREIKELERSIQFARIPGFWSTPKELANHMVSLANIEPGMRVLEPSAGKGNIAEAIRTQSPECAIDVAERNFTLRQILQLKNFNVVSDDCLAIAQAYDRIVMNPPFEDSQDIDHVKHCYSLLAPNGRLVAIVSAGSFSTGTKKRNEFQAWLEEINAVIEPLEEQDYGKDHGRVTGVRTCLLTLDK